MKRDSITSWKDFKKTEQRVIKANMNFTSIQSKLSSSVENNKGRKKMPCALISK